MLKNIDRRSFMTTVVSGIGVVVFSKDLIPVFGLSSTASPDMNRKKKLLATTDYNDNILGKERSFARVHLDELNKYLSSIGVTRHQWIVNAVLNHYDHHSDGFDLLKEATESAHAHGLEFYAEIKPFEGGGVGNTYPHTMPFPKGACALKDIRGIYPVSDPFVAKHPHLCLKRRPGTYQFNGKVSEIRLVKGDDRPTRIGAEHLSIWTSLQNNRFEKYNGPVSFRESVQWRPTFPKGKLCRILHLEGLKIPDGHKYLLVRCSLADQHGDFTNERGNIVELVDYDGHQIPLILSSGRVHYKDHFPESDMNSSSKYVRYFQSPEFKSEFIDVNKAKAHYQDFYSFNERDRSFMPYTIDKEGYVAVACGKPEYMLGNLHPIYPEVREHWLDKLRYCLDRGVDGINIRTSNHTRSPEAYEYGFNDPVIEAAGGNTNYPAIRRINGNAYTQFLREARDLVKSRGKSLTIHLYAQMLMPDDRFARLSYIPPNIEWQWETWVREIADDLEFRGAWTLRPWNLRQVLDTFSMVTSAAKKPFYFQGNMKELGYEGPHTFTQGELDMVRNTPGMDGFVLYETANFTRLNEKGQINGSIDLASLLYKYSFSK